MEKIQGFHKQTGQWILLSEWELEDVNLEALVWLDELDMNATITTLPNCVYIVTADFSAFRRID